MNRRLRTTTVVRGPARGMLVLVLLATPMTAALAQSARGPGTDWGGGYVRGPDSASTTVATSGAGANKPPAVIVPATPAGAPLTDWGGGYLRGPDSASTTVANSGAGPAKPDR